MKHMVKSVKLGAQRQGDFTDNSIASAWISMPFYEIFNPQK
jgi:hypothetical protein